MLMRKGYKRIYSTAKKLHWQAKLPNFAIVLIANDYKSSGSVYRRGKILLMNP
jgi:hypothetical protein